MVICSGDVSTTQLPAAVVDDMDESLLSDKTKRALHKTEKAISKEREAQHKEQQGGAVAHPDAGVDEQTVAGGLPRVYQLASEAGEYRKQQTAQWASTSQSGIKQETFGNSKMPLSLALSSQVVEGKDGEVWYTDQVLSKEFRNDWVAVSRDRRFWVNILPEWRVAMLEGHDTTYGSCFIAKWSTVSRFAVVRVRAMKVDKAIVHSVKWDQRDKKQTFRVEVMTPARQVETHSQLYDSSGFHIGPVSSNLLMKPVELLRTPEGGGSGLLVIDEICKLKKKKLQQIVVDEGFLQLEVAKMGGKSKKITLERVEGWGRLPCTRCRSSWFGPKKGCLVRCKQCERVFHQHCYKPKIKASEKDNWMCQVCTGEDTDVCIKCGGEWSQEAEDSDSSEEDENQLLQCETCSQWHHQHCHTPIIKPIPAGSFHCCTCAPDTWTKWTADKAAADVKAAAVAKAAVAKAAAAKAAKAAKATRGTTRATPAPPATPATPAVAIAVGSLVEVIYMGSDTFCHGRRYPATVDAMHDDGTVHIQYDDDSSSEDDVPLDRIQIHAKATAAAARAVAQAAAQAAGGPRSSLRRGEQSAQQKHLHVDANVPAAAKRFGHSTTRAERATWAGLDPAATAREKQQQKKP